MHDPQPNTKSHGVFPTTYWTVVNALREAPLEDRNRLLTEFLERYLSAFRFHLLHGRGIKHEQDLEDVLQGFITDKLIVKSVLDYVHRDTGRLRDYLRRCLDNYVYSQHRSKMAVAWDRREGIEAEFDDPKKAHMPAPCPFDVAWSRSVMSEAVVRTKDQFHYGHRPHVWDVLDLRYLRPVFLGCEPVSYEELASKIGLEVKAVHNCRVTALRAFDKHLREVISEYIGEDPRKIQDEMYALNKIMRRAGGLDQLDIGIVDY